MSYLLPQLRYRDKNHTNIQQLMAQGLDPILAEIFDARGIQTLDELKEEFELLPQPKALKGMEEATHLLLKHIQAQSEMIVVADYDCDGATSCAVALKGLGLFGVPSTHLAYVVPNRFVHGYGLTPEIVDLALARMPNARLLITVDNGISSIDGVAYANQRGLDVLITDHHLSSKDLPKAQAIVNPNQPYCTFPSKNIAGVGVMFYVLLGLRQHMRDLHYFDKHTQPKLEQLLDLVALGTVADVVKLDHINRILVQKGLQRLRRGLGSAGILALLEVAKKNPQQLKAQDFGFILGPRINAAGRLDDMGLGIQCLMSQSLEKAQTYALALDEMNKERRNIETEMRQDIHLSEEETQKKASIVLFQEDWHQGVIGILASRVKDRYHRPTLIFARNSEEDDGLIKASGRSIVGFHMRDAIDAISKQYPNMITKFGGHAMAAGLSIHKDQYALFCQAFENLAKTQLSFDDLTKTVVADVNLPKSYHSEAFCNVLESYIWGQGFQSPYFYQDFVVEDLKILKDTHTKFILRWDDGQTIEAIWFGHAATDDLIGQKIRAVYQLQQNTWQNKSRLQLVIATLTHLSHLDV